MKKTISVIVICLLLSGCSTMTPARYSISIDTNQILKQYDGKKIHIVSIKPPQNYDSNCRMMGPIQAADGMNIPDFIMKSFNDEFKFAGIYNEQDGTKITATMNIIEFSSSAGLTNGWWNLSITLLSSNGKELTVTNRYDFPSGFDAVTACNQTAQALGAATQDLIKKVSSDPEFKQLM